MGEDMHSKLIAVMATFALLFFPTALLAEDMKERCGEPPKVDDERLKGEIEGKAKLIPGFVGKAELGGAIEITKQDVFQKYPDASKARTTAYMSYVTCVLIMQDTKMTTLEKIRAIQSIDKEIRGNKQTQDFEHIKIVLSSIDFSGERKVVARLKAINASKTGRRIAIAFVHNMAFGCPPVIRDQCSINAIVPIRLKHIPTTSRVLPLARV